MRALKNILRCAVLGAALALVPATAWAAGIAVDESALAVEARDKLAVQIQAERAQKPQAFAAVANVKGHRPEHYRNFRNPKPTVARELRGLGAAALLPMLEALAFKAPARGSLTEEEWTALGVGMLDAVGMLRDARSRAVLHAAFESKSLSPALRFAAARAVGKLGGDADLALLTQHAKKSDPLELYAIHGLGELRRVESAKHLAAQLETAKDDKTAQAIVEALGRVGSSWAWKAMGPNAASAGLETRKICATALAPRFVKGQGKLRTASREAILMLEHPESLSLLRALRPASGPTAHAVDSLVATIEKQLQRR